VSFPATGVPASPIHFFSFFFIHTETPLFDRLTSTLVFSLYSQRFGFPVKNVSCPLFSLLEIDVAKVRGPTEFCFSASPGRYVEVELSRHRSAAASHRSPPLPPTFLDDVLMSALPIESFLLDTTILVDPTAMAVAARASIPDPLSVPAYKNCFAFPFSPHAYGPPAGGDVACFFSCCRY